jgi:lipid-binding SYLF domain-containing protein
MNSFRTTLFAASLAVALVVGCSTAPKGEEARKELNTEAEAALASFKAKDKSLEPLLSKSVGYAIFPSVGKGGLVVGAAYGRGSVYEKGNFIGYADIRQGSVGAQVGGQEFAQLMVFETPEALYKFKNNNFTFGADASAVALKEGAATATEFKDGVAVFVDAKSGLMAGAVISGQKFTFLPKDVPNTQAATTQPAR